MAQGWRIKISGNRLDKAGRLVRCNWHTGKLEKPRPERANVLALARGPTRSTPLRTRSHARAWEAAPTHARAAKQMTDPPAQLTSHRPRGKASGLYSWLYFGRIGYGQ
jgi:hypothetical protein